MTACHSRAAWQTDLSGIIFVPLDSILQVCQNIIIHKHTENCLHWVSARPAKCLRSAFPSLCAYCTYSLFASSPNAYFLDIPYI